MRYIDGPSTYITELFVPYIMKSQSSNFLTNSRLILFFLCLVYTINGLGTNLEAMMPRGSRTKCTIVVVFVKSGSLAISSIVWSSGKRTSFITYDMSGEKIRTNMILIVAS